MTKNPNKYIRSAFLTALNNIGCPVYSNVVPRSVTPVPSVYALLTTQTKSRTAQTKCGYDYECSIIVDIVSVQASGNSNLSLLDDIEEKVTIAIKGLVTIPGGFKLKDVRQEESYSSDIDTGTQSIWRNILRFNLIVGEG